MPREKIKMKKIEKTAARQVTFSKRRRGLFKKAQDLAILCDAQVGVIVFSSTGKLYDFSTTSMMDIIERYNMILNNGIKSVKPSHELQPETEKSESKGNEMEEIDQLRCLGGEDIQGLTLNELMHLEKTIENGLFRVLERKDQIIMEEISGLQEKGEKLMEENALLRQQVIEMTKDERHRALPEHVGISHDGMQSSGLVTSTSNPEDTQDFYASYDTSLKLGLPLK